MIALGAYLVGESSGELDVVLAAGLVRLGCTTSWHVPTIAQKVRCSKPVQKANTHKPSTDKHIYTYVDIIFFITARKTSRLLRPLRDFAHWELRAE